MSKCTKVKRPCKICLETVTLKNGLQCQGACQSWVHYTCLNYTPGKITDIKNGIIRVTCPCPDCKTIMPKEYRTDQPFSCSNQKCPANRPPKCVNQQCPTNNTERQVYVPAPCPLSDCGTSCKQHSNALLPFGLPPPQLPTQPCVPIPPQPRVAPSLSDGCFDPNRCDSGCSSATTVPKRDVPGDYGGTTSTASMAPSLHAVEQMCNTLGQLTSQLNDLINKMQNSGTVKQTDSSGGILRGCKPGGAPNTPAGPKYIPAISTSCTCREKGFKLHTDGKP